jgi:hypothetical protein
MAQFQAFAPGVEVNGETVLSVVAGLGSFKARAVKTLRDAGIDNPQSGRWYAQQAWLDAFREIAEQLGPNTLYSIGRTIPDSAKFPPTIRGVQGALDAIDVAYHMNHRGGEIGHYRYTGTGERSGMMECRNPYPCEFDKGIIISTANKFRPPATSVRVDHDDSRPCRKSGADSCAYRVSW